MFEKLAPAVQVLANFDAGTRVSNPGPSAIAVVFYSLDGGRWILHEEADLVGDQTNNQAEYLAFLKALQVLVDHAPDLREVWIRSDSKLVVQQALGNWKVRGHLRQLHYRGFQLGQELKDRGVIVHIEHIPRSQNTYADMLVTDMLDEYVGRKRGY